MLPVHEVLPRLLTALESGAAVLTAPPGTGKTTVVPLALAEGGRRVLVAEPRRIAARAAARRMAWSLGEKVGARVGYTVRGDRQAGPETVVEVVTTGVLLQRLHRDPELAGVDVVLMDECHERHLDADTALAFLLDVRATIRPELRLLAASATADAARWSRLLGDAPVVEATGIRHPVEIIWTPAGTEILRHISSVVRLALARHSGDVLCFLPGVRELATVAGLLSGLPGDVRVLQVHGQASADQQDAVLTPGPERRVILATAVAESSLTIPGVRVVVDSGLSREPRMDHARGLGSLVTVRVSKASATQRAGRAAREAPGIAYRCWSAAEHDRLAAYPQPEIATADLTDFALQIAHWGSPDATGLALLDPPPPGALAAAQETLHSLGALDGTRLTARGRTMTTLGVHPRLARALLDSTPRLGPARAAEIVTLLADPALPGEDLVTTLRALRDGRHPGAARWRQETRRLTTRAPSGSAAAADGDDFAVGMVVALAFPERVARRRGQEFVMASGTAAEGGPRLAGAEWLAIANADRPPGRASARIRQAVAIDEELARLAAGSLLTTEDEIGWRRGEIVARRITRLGAIELTSTPLPGADLRPAVHQALTDEGLTLLRWTPEATALRHRMAFCHRTLGAPWPATDDTSLITNAETWLEPELSQIRRRDDFTRIDVHAALKRLLPWSARLDYIAPERIRIPSGSQIRIDYSTDPPVLAAKLQELFGWTATPTVAGVPLTIHLLSPAGRATAITTDLPSFWRTAYPQVRAELRGRYPRHPWPEDPLTATPTSRTNPRR
ncbi:ATP-dependent helicase HrpB [Acrocarpospora catenulata]|uniref:ATP-dependent helicase HrpB n=1 Tax=Acrocarpospora catenulata TaxID=2836182 RepID=UPI001BDA0DB3|nr:ATP-dependent helicase HrpB [Acrocarpospora catenulata]